MRYVGPMDFAALRGVLGAVLLFGVLWAVGAPLKPKHVVKTIVLGVFQTAGFVGLISWALASGAAGKSAVLGYTMPFWVIVFGWPFLPDRLRGWQWPAAGLILIGLVLVLELWAGVGDTNSSLLALGAGITWAISVIVFKKIPVESRDDLLSVTAWQMVFGMVPLVVIAWLTDERPIVWSGYFIGALAYNAVGGVARVELGQQHGAGPRQQLHGKIGRALRHRAPHDQRRSLGDRHGDPRLGRRRRVAAKFLQVPEEPGQARQISRAGSIAAFERARGPRRCRRCSSPRSRWS